MGRKLEGRLIGRTPDTLQSYGFNNEDRVRALKSAYVIALRKHGIYGKAAREIGVPITTVRQWRAVDAEFGAQVDESVEEALDKAEEKLVGLLDSVRDDVALKASIFLLSTKRRETYGNKVEVEHVPIAPRYVTRVPRPGVIDVGGALSLPATSLRM